MEPKSAANYGAMKRKILTNVAALSLLFAVASTQGSYMGRGYGDYHGDRYGYPTYGYGPSIVGPAYVGNPWGYGYDTDGLDDWSGYDLPPPAPNPVGPSKTIEIPSDRGQ
jgi:hypothetical protein